MRIALSVIVCGWTVLLTGCSAAHSGAREASMSTGILFRQVAVNGVERRYAVYVPRDYDASRAWPTIIFLNGSGECGEDGQKQALVGLGSAALGDAKAWPFLIVFPQKPDAKSTWVDHDALIFAALRDVESHFRVDRARLYLTGLSQGGFGTWNIAAKHPGTFAAIAPVCGWADVSIAGALKKTPTWAFHGAKDDVVRFESSRDIVAAIEAAGGEAKFTLFPEANHNSWDPAYRGDQNLGAWFLQHRLFGVDGK